MLYNVNILFFISRKIIKQSRQTCDVFLVFVNSTPHQLNDTKKMCSSTFHIGIEEFSLTWAQQQEEEKKWKYGKELLISSPYYRGTIKKLRISISKVLSYILYISSLDDYLKKYFFVDSSYCDKMGCDETLWVMKFCLWIVSLSDFLII